MFPMISAMCCFFRRMLAAICSGGRCVIRKAKMGVWTLFWPQKVRVVFPLAIDAIQRRQHQSMAPKAPF